MYVATMFDQKQIQISKHTFPCSAVWRRTCTVNSCFLKSVSIIAPYRFISLVECSPRVYLSNIWVKYVQRLLEILTVFQTKLCDIYNPIYIRQDPAEKLLRFVSNSRC